ncbi:MAG: 50S ribosomal protein L4 [Flexibacteraceae bacterium]|jgi:large subunit ribosomal protein L4
MELSVINYKGQDTGRTVTLSDAVFGVEPNTHAVYLDVKQYLANQRQGTHKSKERAEIARTTKKLKRQKGTGGARAGSMKSPLFVGGGRVFGPRPRDYRFKLNQKMKVVARRSVLAAKAKGAQVMVLEDFNFDKPSTKSYINFLSDVKVTNKSLLVLAESTPNVYLSARNLKGVKVVTADTLNTYDIINAQQLLISEKSLERITALLA